MTKIIVIGYDMVNHHM